MRSTGVSLSDGEYWVLAQDGEWVTTYNSTKKARTKSGNPVTYCVYDFLGVELAQGTLKLHRWHYITLGSPKN
ncbi:hypothetical protein [Cylindrospermopsis raciborskii]|uniref:hypothetical protein n=1 Tax=Cylindrospermopsis raciborskii TaxID=77022 RepID=UPI0038D0BCAE